MRTEIFDRWKRSKESPYYFVTNCIRTNTPTGKIELLHPRNYQRVLLKYFSIYSKIVITKSRQMGISDISLAYALWKMLFGDEKSNILFITSSQYMAENLKNRMEFMYKNLPPEMQFCWIENNRNSFVINNGSKFSVMSSNSTPHGICGQSLSLCAVDDAAFCYDMKNIWSMIYSSILPNGKIIVSSSLNELGDWFDELTLFQNLVDAKYVKLPWYKHPEKDFNWERETRKMLSKRQFARDFECKFIE